MESYKQVKFFPKIDMYDVTNEIATDGSNQSPFLMVLKWLETKFNFTAKVFLRKDMKYGYPKAFSNGSIVLDRGAFRDMFEGSVDFVCTPLVMLPERAQIGIFLPPIYVRREAIYIPIMDSNEYLDWNVYCFTYFIDWR